MTVDTNATFRYALIHNYEPGELTSTYEVWFTKRHPFTDEKELVWMHSYADTEAQGIALCQQLNNSL